MPQAVAWVGAYLFMSEAAVGLGAFLLTYAVEIGTAAIILGGMAYSADQQRKAKNQAKDAYNAAQVDRLANVVSTTAPRELVMGRVRKGGSIFYRASTGNNLQELYVAVALAAHEIDAVEEIYLGDVPVTLDGSGFVTTAPYAITTTKSGSASTGTGYTVTLPATYVAGSASGVYEVPGGEGGIDYMPGGVSVTGLTATATQINTIVNYQYTDSASNVQIFAHLGTAGQTADAALLAAFPSDWIAANIVNGCAYLVAKYTYNETSFPSGVQTISAVIRGAKLYDPRTGLTVWSENPALMMRHVYAHPKFGKATVTAAEDARFTAAANACDTSTVWHIEAGKDAAGAVIAAHDVTEPLYKASIVVPFGTPAKSALDDLSQAMGGSWAFAGGELYCKAGVYTAPVMSLGEADLAVIQRTGAQETQVPINISVHQARAQKINTVKVKIWDQASDYKQVSLTPLIGAALLTRDGVELAQEVTFPAIGRSYQALHVAGIMMRDGRDPLAVELPFKLTAYPLELFDTVSLTLSRYGWSAKTFTILGRSWSANGSLMLTLKETSAAITQMDAGFLAQGFAVNTNLPAPWEVAGVGAITVTSGTAELLKQTDGTIVSRMRISWPQVTDAAVLQNGKIEVQFRNAFDGTDWTNLQAQGNDTSVATSDVQDGFAYIARARARTTLGVGDWSAHVLHQVLGKTEPPPVFDTFTVMAQPDGTRQFNFSYTTAAPVDWLGAEIRYVSGTVASPDWASMTKLQDSMTYYTSSPVEVNAPLSGTYTFACKSLDTTGNESAYLVRTITLPSRRLGDVFDEYYDHLEGWLGTLTDCHIQDGELISNDTTTWDTLPSTWAAWTRWIFAPSSPVVYVTPVRDFGTIIVAQVNTTVVADGSILQELSTSNDGTTWSAWSSASGPISARYLKLRLTVTETVAFPVPMVREFGYLLNALIKSEYINDCVITSLSGSYRIGVGDVRVPLLGTYSVIKRTSIVIQDSSAGAWTFTRIDQALTYGPRYQFKLNGVLADPDFVDFFVEGY